MGTALLIARTVRHLRPSQLAHRVRLRGQRVVFPLLAGPLTRALRRAVPPDPGWPAGFAPIDSQIPHGAPDPEANAEGTFLFLAERRALGDRPDWEPADASQLWRYNLHYLEWAWAFAAHPDRGWSKDAFARLWRSWRAGTRFGLWDAWSPYVASVRAWTLCGLYGPLVQGTPMDSGYREDLALHAGFVRANLELDVGGNHLVKNMKALVGMGVFLRDERLLQVAVRHLRRQLPRQVLPDGGHFERSPSYHCQVMGDLIDVSGLLEASGAEAIAELDAAIRRMRAWLGAMLMPDGGVPSFNDCEPVGRDRMRLLRPDPPPPERLTILPDSGYAVLRGRTDGMGVHVIADVGLPCPPDLPAHAHADCLSFELSVNGRRLVVDTGTSTYAPGPRRDLERGTRAHNTVEIDGTDQTEVWGAFRAGRRAIPRVESVFEGPEEVGLSASHDGFERLSGRPRHIRTWRLRAGRLEVTDRVEGRGTHQVVTRFHLAPGTLVSARAAGLVAGPLRIWSDSGELRTEEALVAAGFGLLEPTVVLILARKAQLPVECTVVLDPGQPLGDAG